MASHTWQDRARDTHEKEASLGMIESVLHQIASHLPPDTLLTFHHLKLPPKGQERVTKREEMAALVETALKVRAEYRVPFWDAVLLLSEDQPLPLRMAILDAVSLHQPMVSVEKTVVPADKITEDLLSRIACAREGQITTISSRVLIGTHEYHIPMIDFRMKVTDSSSEIAAAIVSRLGQNGALLRSGNSYHFYGLPPLLNAEGLRRFLGSAALFSPFVDQRWVSHQVIEGACALRISPGKGFDQGPKLISWVD